MHKLAFYAHFSKFVFIIKARPNNVVVVVVVVVVFVVLVLVVVVFVVVVVVVVVVVFFSLICISAMLLYLQFPIMSQIL